MKSISNRNRPLCHGSKLIFTQQKIDNINKQRSHALTASKCVRWCLARSELLLNTLVHPSYWHPYGRSPVCDLWWIFKFSSRENDLSHPSNCKRKHKPKYMRMSIISINQTSYCYLSHENDIKTFSKDIKTDENRLINTSKWFNQSVYVDWMLYNTKVNQSSECACNACVFTLTGLMISSRRKMSAFNFSHGHLLDHLLLKALENWNKCICSTAHIARRYKMLPKIDRS